MIGRSTCFAISRTISSVNALGFVDVPIRTWGLTWWMTECKSGFLSDDHSLSSLAKGTWAGVSLSPWDFRRRPGLSMHLCRQLMLEFMCGSAASGASNCAIARDGAARKTVTIRRNRSTGLLQDDMSKCQPKKITYQICLDASSLDLFV